MEIIMINKRKHFLENLVNDYYNKSRGKTRFLAWACDGGITAQVQALRSGGIQLY
jgi:hypothetical protein